jgi:PCFT/HCP family folate transporter-like MFS transporter 1/3
MLIFKMPADSDEDTEVPTESARLLGAPLPGERAFFQARSPRTIVLLLCLNIFCLSAAGSIATVPITRILEDILCRRHHDGLQGRASDGGVDERLCKADVIQSELAYLLGAMSTVEAITGV